MVGGSSTCFRKLAHDNHTQDFVLGDVFGPSVSDQPAVLYDRDTVQQIEYVIQIMADQKNTDALAFDLFSPSCTIRIDGMSFFCDFGFAALKIGQWISER